MQLIGRPTSCCATGSGSPQARSPMSSPSGTRATGQLLIEITARCCARRRKTASHWSSHPRRAERRVRPLTVKSALDLGVPVTHPRGGVRRALSGSVTQRKATTGLASASSVKSQVTPRSSPRCPQALYARRSCLCAGLQPHPGRQRRIRLGITRATSPPSGGGCIIARSSEPDQGSIRRGPNLPSLIVAPYFRSAVENAIDSLAPRRRHRTELASDPGFSSALSYYDGCARAAARGAHPGLRDFFGAHTTGASTPTRAKSPHALEWGPQRDSAYLESMKFLEGHPPPYDLTYNDVFIVRTSDVSRRLDPGACSS